MILPEHILNKIDPAQRAKLGPAGLTAAEANAQATSKLERAEQRIFANWLLLQEQAGLLSYDWADLHRRTTARRGMPDFKIYRQGRVLFAEMKVNRATLSLAQREQHIRLERAGNEIVLWDSADTAIRGVKNWLSTHWGLWAWGASRT